MEFQGKSLRCQLLEDGIVEMTFDLHDESVNKFNRLTMEEFREVVQRLSEATSLKGLLINSAKEAFIVGADINEFLLLFQTPQEELTQELKKQRLTFPPYYIFYTSISIYI